MMIEILLACAGAVGFAVLFRMEQEKLWIIALGSAASWYVYLLLCDCLKEQNIAMFMITALIVFLSGIVSIFTKCPGLLFSTPILIPFIPGAALYYVMYDIVSQSGSLAKDVRVLCEQAGAMVMGILAAELGVVFLQKMYEKQKWFIRMHC